MTLINGKGVIFKNWSIIYFLEQSFKWVWLFVINMYTFVNYDLCIYLKREIQYKNIYSMYNRARQSRSPEQTRQVLYTTVVLFLECLYTYVSSVDPQSFLGPSASHTPLVLMEKFENESADEEPQWVLYKVNFKFIMPLSLFDWEISNQYYM